MRLNARDAGHLGGALAAALLPAAAWAAGDFGLSPIRVELAPGERSALLTVQNKAPQPLRVTVDVKAWSQGPGGDVLGATKDIAVFPPILAVPPGEQRQIRVAARTSFSAEEKAYRLYLEELPSSRRTAQPGTVAVLLKVSLPIFLTPRRPRAAATLEGPTFAAGKVSFQIRNDGNLHYAPPRVAVRALDRKGQPLLEKKVNGWYVLARSTHAYELAIPREACVKAVAFEVDVPDAGRPMKGRVLKRAGAAGCGS